MLVGEEQQTASGQQPNCLLFARQEKEMLRDQTLPQGVADAMKTEFSSGFCVPFPMDTMDERFWSGRAWFIARGGV